MRTYTADAVDRVGCFSLCLSAICDIVALYSGKKEATGDVSMQFLIVGMIPVSVLIGNGVIRVLYGKNSVFGFSAADYFLTGEIAVIGAAGAAHLCAVSTGLTFSRSVTVFAGLLAALTLVSLAVTILCRPAERQRADRKAERSPLLVFFWLLVLSQVLYMTLGGGVYLGGDMTVETVGSFLHTDGIYQVNPLTGAEYREGMPARFKILCLPGLYGALCRLFSLRPETLVWRLIPLATLLGCYCAYACLARCIFKEDTGKRHFFLVLTAMLIWAGNYAYGMDGFGVLNSGWRGAVIRNAVLVPYLISLCLRKRWKLAALCIVAEAVMVWTLYGAGVCLLTAAALAVCGAIWRRADARRGREAAV